MAKIDPKLVAACIAAYGKHLGGNIISVRKVAWDKRYDARQKEGRLNLNKKFFLYETVVIPVRETKIIGRDANDCSYVMFNNNSKYQLPLLDIKSASEVILEPTPELIRDVVEGRKNKWGFEYIFADHAKVCELVKSLNIRVTMQIKSFIEEMLGNLSNGEMINSLEDSKLADARSGMTLVNAIFSGQDISFNTDDKDDTVEVTES